jgi:hypothetical protein
MRIHETSLFSHLSLPAMITLAEKGRIKKKFAKFKHQLSMCMSCIFGMAHHKPWHSKGSKGSIRKESNVLPENRSVCFNWYWHN